MVRGFVLFLCVFLSLPSIAKVKLSAQKVMLGEALTLIVWGENIEADFEKLDKSPIRKHVEIFDIEGDSDRLRLKLYPRRAGRFIFPALKQGQIDFPATEVTVEENPEVKIEWSGLPDKAWVNQKLLWSAEVKVTDSAHAVSLAAHPHPNAKVQKQLSKTPYFEQKTLAGKTSHLGMLVSSGDKGAVRFRTPVVRVKNRTNKPWLFFDESYWVNIKPLSSYLPLNIPLGKIDLTANALDFWLERGRMYDWHIMQKANTFSANQLIDVTQQLGGENQVEWLVPKLKKYQVWQKEGQQALLDIHQPVRFHGLGLVKLPELRLTYLDVSSGRLEDVWLEESMHFILPSWLLLALQVIFWLLVLLLALISWQLLRLAWLKWQLVRQMKQASSVNQLWAVIENWNDKTLGETPDQVSLKDWQATLRQHCSDDKTQAMVDLLNRAFYAADKSVDYAKLQQAALDWGYSVSWLKLAFCKEVWMRRYFLKAMAKA